MKSPPDFSSLANAIPAKEAAEAYLTLGNWDKVWKQFHPEIRYVLQGSRILNERQDIRAEVTRILRDRVGLLTKTDLLAELALILQDQEHKVSDRIQAIRTYSEMAGFNAEGKKQITEIRLTREDVETIEGRELQLGI